MFNIQDLEKAVKIQKQAYPFLLWIIGEIDSGKITFSRVHQTESSADAIYDWLVLIKEYNYLPKSIRIDYNHLQEFSNYFASYLTSSFDIVDNPDWVLDSSTWCHCELCRRLVKGSHLQVKKPTCTDKELARQKRKEGILGLASENNLSIPDEIVDELADSTQTIRDASYLAYAHTLLDRIRGKFVGVYALVLWRGIAWKPSGGLIKDFSLEAKNIIAAEKRLHQLISLSIHK